MSNSSINENSTRTKINLSLSELLTPDTSLVLHGTPKSGKSSLVSHLEEHLRQANQTVIAIDMLQFKTASQIQPDHHSILFLKEIAEKAKIDLDIDLWWRQLKEPPQVRFQHFFQKVNHQQSTFLLLDHMETVWHSFLAEILFDAVFKYNQHHARKINLILIIDDLHLQKIQKEKRLKRLEPRYFKIPNLDKTELSSWLADHPIFPQTAITSIYQVTEGHPHLTRTLEQAFSKPEELDIHHIEMILQQKLLQAQDPICTEIIRRKANQLPLVKKVAYMLWKPIHWDQLENIELVHLYLEKRYRKTRQRIRGLIIIILLGLGILTGLVLQTKVPKSIKPTSHQPVKTPAQATKISSQQKSITIGFEKQGHLLTQEPLKKNLTALFTGSIKKVAANIQNLSLTPITYDNPVHMDILINTLLSPQLKHEEQISQTLEKMRKAGINILVGGSLGEAHSSNQLHLFILNDKTKKLTEKIILLDAEAMECLNQIEKTKNCTQIESHLSAQIDAMILESIS